MIDVAAVPDGLENPVGKAKSQNVLDSFFAQVMINAIDLVLGDAAQQLLVQRLCRLQIVTERLFYDYPAPVLASTFIHQSDCGKVFNDLSKKLGSSGQVEKVILMRGVIFIQLL